VNRRRNKSKADSSLSESMFVGMDVHKNYLQVADLDEKGKVLDNSRVDNNLTKGRTWIIDYSVCTGRRNNLKPDVSRFTIFS